MWKLIWNWASKVGQIRLLEALLWPACEYCRAYRTVPVYLFIGKLIQLHYIGCRLIQFNWLRVEVSLGPLLCPFISAWAIIQKKETINYKPGASQQGEKSDLRFLFFIFCHLLLYFAARYYTASAVLLIGSTADASYWCQAVSLPHLPGTFIFI